MFIISRFEQIKQQEARLRQQREEEERKKAGEAAKLESQTINDGDESATVRVVVNGSLSRQDMKEDQNGTSVSTKQRTEVDAVEHLPSATREEVNPRWLFNSSHFSQFHINCTGSLV